MKRRVREVGMILLGNFVVAIATVFLILPNNILNGGTAGMAIAIEPILHLDKVMMTSVFTIGLYVLGALTLGKEFALKSLISTLCYPVFVTGLSWVAALYPPETFVMPQYVASIYSGVISGVGLGLVFRVNSSTGGVDVLALLLNKYVHLKMGASVIVVDALTVLLGTSTFGLVPSLIGIMSVYVVGIAIDKTVAFGSQPAKNVMVISEQYDLIRQRLMDEIDRGITLLDGRGGYTNQNRPVLMCVIQQKELNRVQSLITSIDEQAFIIVHDVHEVHGEGFTYLAGGGRV